MRALRKILSLALTVTLLFQQIGFAQIATELNIAGYLSRMSSNLSVEKFRPAHLRYFSYDIFTNNFKVLLDKGDIEKGLSPQGTVPFQEETQTLLNYFLVGVTLPDSMFWVNLRPDSEDQIIDQYIEKTDLGRIMLEADLQLKKDTSAMTSPATPEGKEYWDRLYKKAASLYGYDNVTIPTLTRPWIVPGEIIVRESKDSAYIYKATLKVMLEQDYLQGTGDRGQVTGYSQYQFKDSRSKALNEYSTHLIKELIIPKLTKEVNSSKRYAPLRQVYYSLILSRWFKQKFRGQKTEDRGQKNSYINLIDTKNLTNLISKDSWSKTDYFKQYQQSFSQGEYNIQEPVYTPTGQVIRSYFSGGIQISSPITPNGFTGRDMPTAFLNKAGVLLEGNSQGITEVAGSPITANLEAIKQFLAHDSDPSRKIEAPAWGVFFNKAGRAKLVRIAELKKPEWGVSKFEFRHGNGKIVLVKAILQDVLEYFYISLFGDDNNIYKFFYEGYTVEPGSDKIIPKNKFISHLKGLQDQLEKFGYRVSPAVAAMLNPFLNTVAEGLKNLSDFYHGDVWLHGDGHLSIGEVTISMNSLPIGEFVFGIGMIRNAVYERLGRQDTKWSLNFKVGSSKEDIFRKLQEAVGIIASPEQASNSSPIEKSGSKPIVLIVDDDRDNRWMIKHELKRQGFEPDQLLEAADGEEALEILNNQKADLVLSDYSMPEMDGGELYKKMSEDKDLQGIPFVMLTGDFPDSVRKELKLPESVQIFDKSAPFAIVIYPVVSSLLNDKERKPSAGSPINERVLENDTLKKIFFTRPGATWDEAKERLLQPIRDLYNDPEIWPVIKPVVEDLDKLGDDAAIKRTEEEILLSFNKRYKDYLKNGLVIYDKLEEFLNISRPHGNTDYWPKELITSKIQGMVSTLSNFKHDPRIYRKGNLSEAELNIYREDLQDIVKKLYLLLKAIEAVDRMSTAANAASPEQASNSSPVEEAKELALRTYAERLRGFRKELVRLQQLIRTVGGKYPQDWPVSPEEMLPYAQLIAVVSDRLHRASMAAGSTDMAKWIEEGMPMLNGVKNFYKFFVNQESCEEFLKLSIEEISRQSELSVWSATSLQNAMRIKIKNGYVSQYFGLFQAVQASLSNMQAELSVMLRDLNAMSATITGDTTAASPEQTSNSSPMQSVPETTGGIDFRALPMTIQPMGSFTGLNFKLPKLSQADLARMDIDVELAQIQRMASSGILPSGERVKELIAACIQKQKINAYTDRLLLCLINIFKLEEVDAVESSPALREALVLVDAVS